MKRLCATLLSLIWLAPASAQIKAGSLSKPGAAPTTLMPMQNPPTIAITSPASQPSQPAPAEYFTGIVRLTPLPASCQPSRLGGASVSFEAGARTNWHTHPLGQTLIVTQGAGRVQSVGGPIQEMRMGDVVQIPPGVKHWHGAAPESAMTHIALAESQDGKAVNWLEKVSDEQYGAAAPTQAITAPPSRAQALMGDIAPKLAELTDQVLFGDVWERPGLSKRDRSLATVSALIALNRPDQLRSHLTLARQNGLTEEQLVEAITHLAFYAGWPSAVSAVGVAREVFAVKPPVEGAAPSTK